MTKRQLLDDENRQRLVDARHKAGLSQAKLAERLGVSWNAIAMCERNLRQPSTDLLDRWAAELGLELVVTLKRRRK